MLDFKNITKIYKNDLNYNKVLDNINITINNNEISLIRGNSGVGKSTLLNIIGCLLIPNEGKVYCDGLMFDLSKDDITNFRINNFAYVFQDYNLLPEFNVHENLLLPSYINNIDINKTEKKIDTLLDYMNISYLKKSYPSSISHGEKQRVSILRSLLGKQKIILADEPTGNLDEINTKNILDLIANINKDLNYTFIIASHDKNFISIAHNVYNIKNKKINKYNE